MRRFRNLLKFCVDVSDGNDFLVRKTGFVDRKS